GPHAPHRPAAGRRRVDAQDQGHRDPAGAHRADDAGRGPRRKRRIFRFSQKKIPVDAQDHDLRRLERDREEHHRENDVGPMNFEYNEEQQLLADSVRRFLAKDYDFEARRKIAASEAGWSPKVWSTFAEMGLTGLPFSPDYGGFGGGAIDLMGVMEAFGEALVVEPYLPTVMAGQLIARSPQAKSILPAIVEGKVKLAFAHGEKGSR